MIREATGDPYGVGPGGLGAVFDAPESNLNEIAKAGLDRLQQDKALALEEQKMSSASRKEASDLIKLAKLDQPGILDTDLGYFTEKAHGIHEFINQGMKNGVDPTQPGNGWYNQLMGMVDNYNMEAKLSATQREEFSKAITKSREPGFDPDETAKLIAQASEIPYIQRNKKLSYNNLVVPVVGSFAEEAQKLVKDINTSGLSEEDKATSVGPFTAIQSTKGLTEEQKLIHAKSLMAANPKKLYGDWQKMGKGMQDFYTEQLAQTLNDPNIPDVVKDRVKGMSPTEYYGYSFFSNGIKHESTLKDLKAQPGADEAAKAKIDYTKGDALYRLVKGLATDNVEYFDNYDKEKGVWLTAPGQPTDELFSTQVSPFVISTSVDAYGGIVDEYCTGVKKVRNDVNNVYVKTTSNPKWTKMPINTFANAVFVNNYADGTKPAEAINALQYMSKNDGTWGNGTVNFTKGFKASPGKAAGSSKAQIKDGVATPVKGQAAKTQAEFNAKWKTLKSGEKLLGPDGKTYTHP